MEKNNSELLTEKEAAEFIRGSVKTLQARRYRHQPPVYYKVGGAIRYKIADLEGWIESGKVEVGG
ncbi:MAG: helix-turn-helix transcriptional regulator [Desulfurivibrionaceae bacterium]